MLAVNPLFPTSGASFACVATRQGGRLFLCTLPPARVPALNHRLRAISCADHQRIEAWFRDAEHACPAAEFTMWECLSMDSRVAAHTLYVVVEAVERRVFAFEKASEHITEEDVRASSPVHEERSYKLRPLSDGGAIYATRTPLQP